MNYETYKTLTIKQKEEYNFKFSDKPKLKFSILLMFCIYLETLMYLMMSYIFFISPVQELQQYKYLFPTLMETGILSRIGLIMIFCFNVLYFLGNIFYYEIKKSLWLKKNKIKIIRKNYLRFFKKIWESFKKFWRLKQW